MLNQSEALGSSFFLRSQRQRLPRRQRAVHRILCRPRRRSRRRAPQPRALSSSDLNAKGCPAVYELSIDSSVVLVSTRVDVLRVSSPSATESLSDRLKSELPLLLADCIDPLKLSLYAISKNAAYLASKQRLDIVGAASSALTIASYDKQTTRDTRCTCSKWKGGKA